jgi:hypothetical protein
MPFINELSGDHKGGQSISAIELPFTAGKEHLYLWSSMQIYVFLQGHCKCIVEDVIVKLLVCAPSSWQHSLIAPN